MSFVEILSTGPLSAEPFDSFDPFATTPPPAGETATIVAHGIVLHPGLAGMIPQDAKFELLLSAGDDHIYFVTVRGYTILQFVAIVRAYAENNVKNAERLIDEIRSSLATQVGY